MHQQSILCFKQFSSWKNFCFPYSPFFLVGLGVYIFLTNIKSSWPFFFFKFLAALGLSYSTRAKIAACGSLVSRPGIESMSPALEGRFLTTGASGKSLLGFVNFLSMHLSSFGGSVKNPPAKRETWIRSLGWEDPLEEGMATHSSILAWRIPWTKESGGLRSMGSQSVWHDWATKHSTVFYQFL